MRARRQMMLAGALLATAAPLAACSSGPGPLGNGGDGGTECVPGRVGQTLSMGFYALENTGTEAAAIQSVTQSGEQGITATKAWVIPIVRHPNGSTLLLGAGFAWPPVTWPTWRDRRPAVGAVIGAGKSVNLAYGVTRTVTGRNGNAACR